MTALTAIDILINPDDTTLKRARATNARLRKSWPDGFALDAQHTPHITVLQRYVRTAELEQVYNAVGTVIAGQDVASFEFRAVRIAHMEWDIPGVGLSVMVLTPDPRVLAFQAELIAAVAPFTESGGTAAAYETDVDETDINETTINYIERYVPDHSGPNSLAHITVGYAKLDDLRAIKAEPFDAFAVHPVGVAVFHLGNNGTARKQLKAWTLTR
ncbi:MAG: hypothetical protein ACXWA9_13360 [Acidimicrobiia bacterium]